MMKTPEEILQKHVPNRFPKDNPYIDAMIEYASQFQQPKKETKTIEERKKEFYIKETLRKAANNVLLELKEFEMDYLTLKPFPKESLLFGNL